MAGQPAAMLAALTLKDGDRARLVYGTRGAHSGVVRIKDYGHTRDFMLDSRGGFWWEGVTAVQRMERRRYVTVWERP